MSAYGDIKRPQTSGLLPSTVWTSEKRTLGAVDSDANDAEYITVHHLTLKTAREQPGLLEYLGAVFAKEVEDGMTYPQEGDMPQATFEAYFFAADVFLGIVGTPTANQDSLGTATNDLADGSRNGAPGLTEVRAGRPWAECIAGYFYVKPNYPGRSSHICNAGFVVPPRQRGYGYGSQLAKAYVYYAPILGYEASVFNLVYVNNIASVKLWERLGFSKAGRIPRAGRLRTKDGNGEEFIDAWVFYKSFIET
ncbi:hypothetical protein D9619_001692 [Psilocybe cf. subviscida]|uniref:N-acetyltransferase domain-containing protein n=1 Tax=Psilocybe cf. subviscida TaxID=2480587 RepID=A0A8H5F3U4_9AGAR|nr:hypothetical protein D9619_001692 [Psilocybe cf. subviscida]